MLGSIFVCVCLSVSMSVCVTIFVLFWSFCFYLWLEYLYQNNWNAHFRAAVYVHCIQRTPPKTEVWHVHMADPTWDSSMPSGKADTNFSRATHHLKIRVESKTYKKITRLSFSVQISLTPVYPGITVKIITVPCNVNITLVSYFTVSFCGSPVPGAVIPLKFSCILLHLVSLWLFFL